MGADRRRRDEHLDLSPLDPCADPARFAATMSRLRHATSDALQRRRAALGVWGFLGRWRGPICVVSGVLAASSLLVLSAPEPAAPDATLADAVGVPDPFVGWVRGDEAPSPAMLLEMEFDGR